MKAAKMGLLLRRLTAPNRPFLIQTNLLATSYRSLLLKYLRPQWSRVLLLALLLLLALGLELVSPVVLARFIDGALAALPAGSLLNLAGLYLAMALGIQLLALAQTYVAGSIALTAMNDLRADLLRHSLALDMNFHNTHTAGELIERVDGDVEILSFSKLDAHPGDPRILSPLTSEAICGIM